MENKRFVAALFSTLLLCLSSTVSVYANEDEPYKFTYEYDSEYSVHFCKMDEPEIITIVPIRSIQANLLIQKDVSVEFQFAEVSEGMLAQLCNSAKANAEGSRRISNPRVLIKLANGELLTSHIGVFIDIRRDDFIGSDDIGGGSIRTNFSVLDSNFKSMDDMTEKQKTGYISQQLRTYDIKSITIDDCTIDFRTFKSAAIINAMFNTLAEKMGNDELFRSTES